MSGETPLVGILMGSDSDWEEMRPAVSVFREFEVPCEVVVSSAHRSPARTVEYTESAAGRGIRVLIAAAGSAAHLAGVVAAHTTLPVLGVPIPSDAPVEQVPVPGDGSDFAHVFSHCHRHRSISLLPV